MGAMVAASVALGHQPDEMIEKFLRAFKRSPIADYTVPVIALTRGRRMRRLLIEHCGAALVENTWKTFFCLSANLSSVEAMVHKEGYLWRALRASAAIPGLVPPMVADGQLFVDGGIIDNFPASVMSSMLRGPVTGVDVTSDWKLEAQASDIEDKSLWWLLGKGRKETPNIVRILTRSGTISGDLQTAANRHIDPPRARVDRHVVVPRSRQGCRIGLPRRRSRHRTNQARTGGRNPEMGEFLALRGRTPTPGRGVRYFGVL